MSPLTVARVGIGLAATVKALELWPVLIRLAGDPRVVQMPLAPWPRPSAAAAPWVAAAWAGLGLTVAAGKAVPITGTLLAALVGYVLTLDQQTYSNHLYLLSLLSVLLALAHTERHRAPALTLLRWQLVVVYAFAAASKINADFLSGRVIAENLPPALGALAAGPGSGGAGRGRHRDRGLRRLEPPASQVARGWRHRRRRPPHRVHPRRHPDDRHDRVRRDLPVHLPALLRLNAG